MLIQYNLSFFYNFPQKYTFLIALSHITYNIYLHWSLHKNCCSSTYAHTIQSQFFYNFPQKYHSWSNTSHGFHTHHYRNQTSTSKTGAIKNIHTINSIFHHYHFNHEISTSTCNLLSWTQVFYTKISECWLQYQKLKISHLKSLLVIHNITKMGFLSQKSFSHLPSLQSSTFKWQDLKYSHIKNGLQLLQFIFSSLHSPHL